MLGADLRTMKPPDNKKGGFDGTSNFDWNVVHDGSATGSMRPEDFKHWLGTPASNGPPPFKAYHGPVEGDTLRGYLTGQLFDGRTDQSIKTESILFEFPQNVIMETYTLCPKIYGKDHIYRDMNPKKGIFPCWAGFNAPRVWDLQAWDAKGQKWVVIDRQPDGKQLRDVMHQTENAKARCDLYKKQGWPCDANFPDISKDSYSNNYKQQKGTKAVRSWCRSTHACSECRGDPLLKRNNHFMNPQQWFDDPRGCDTAGAFGNGKGWGGTDHDKAFGPEVWNALGTPFCPAENANYHVPKDKSGKPDLDPKKWSEFWEEKKATDGTKRGYKLESFTQCVTFQVARPGSYSKYRLVPYASFGSTTKPWCGDPSNGKPSWCKEEQLQSKLQDPPGGQRWPWVGTVDWRTVLPVGRVGYGTQSPLAFSGNARQYGTKPYLRGDFGHKRAQMELSDIKLGFSIDRVEYWKTHCKGDIVGDGKVDIRDVLQLISAHGFNGKALLADLDMDGNVDTKDLLQLLVYFGSCNKPACKVCSTRGNVVPYATSDAPTTSNANVQAGLTASNTLSQTHAFFESQLLKANIPWCSFPQPGEVVAASKAVSAHLLKYGRLGMPEELLRLRKTYAYAVDKSNAHGCKGWLSYIPMPDCHCTTTDSIRITGTRSPQSLKDFEVFVSKSPSGPYKRIFEGTLPPLKAQKTAWYKVGRYGKLANGKFSRTKSDGPHTAGTVTMVAKGYADQSRMHEYRIDLVGGAPRGDCGGSVYTKGAITVKSSVVSSCSGQTDGQIDAGLSQEYCAERCQGPLDALFNGRVTDTKGKPRKGTWAQGWRAQPAPNSPPVVSVTINLGKVQQLSKIMFWPCGDSQIGFDRHSDDRTSVKTSGTSGTIKFFSQDALGNKTPIGKPFASIQCSANPAQVEIDLLKSPLKTSTIVVDVGVSDKGYASLRELELYAVPVVGDTFQLPRAIEGGEHVRLGLISNHLGSKGIQVDEVEFLAGCAKYGDISHAKNAHFVNNCVEYSVALMKAGVCPKPGPVTVYKPSPLCAKLNSACHSMSFDAAKKTSISVTNAQMPAGTSARSFTAWIQPQCKKMAANDRGYDHLDLSNPKNSLNGWAATPGSKATAKTARIYFPTDAGIGTDIYLRFENMGATNGDCPEPLMMNPKGATLDCCNWLLNTYMCGFQSNGRDYSLNIGGSWIGGDKKLIFKKPDGSTATIKKDGTFVGKTAELSFRLSPKGSNANLRVSVAVYSSAADTKPAFSGTLDLQVNGKKTSFIGAGGKLGTHAITSTTNIFYKYSKPAPRYPGAPATLFDYGDGSKAGGRFALEFDACAMHLRTDNKGSGWSNLPALSDSVMDSKWTHVALTMDKGKASWYVNGILAGVKPLNLGGGTSAIDPLAPATVMTIAGGKYTGNIHSIRVWKKALNTMEVLNDFALCVPPIGTPPYMQAEKFLGEYKSNPSCKATAHNCIGPGTVGGADTGLAKGMCPCKQTNDLTCLHHATSRQLDVLYLDGEMPTVSNKVTGAPEVFTFGAVGTTAKTPKGDTGMPFTKFANGKTKAGPVCGRQAIEMRETGSHSQETCIGKTVCNSRISTKGDFMPSGPFTIEAWAMSTTKQKSNKLDVKLISSPLVDIYVFKNDLRGAGVFARLCKSVKGDGVLTTKLDMRDDKWHHFAVTRSIDNTVTLWIDGQAVGKPVAKCGTPPPPGKLWFGDAPAKGDESAGVPKYAVAPTYLDDVRVVDGTAVFDQNFYPACAAGPLLARPSAAEQIKSLGQRPTVRMDCTLQNMKGWQCMYGSDLDAGWCGLEKTCGDIKRKYPGARSGVYKIQDPKERLGVPMLKNCTM
jgi:hypothetical protein